MKKTLYLLIFILFSAFVADAQNTGAKSHVIGFYNLENLFDIYDDPAKNDEQYLPDGQNNWTAEKYAKNKETFLKARGCMEDGHAAERISKEIAKLMEK